MSKNYYIIPIFISHQGCPHQCVFCNQDRIAGVYDEVTANDVREKINSYLDTMDTKNSIIEVSFFGGTFTAIPVAKQKEFLAVAREYKDKGFIHKIRLSTRPDAINGYILNYLKEFKVDIIELGVQSLDDNVLRFYGYIKATNSYSAVMSTVYSYELNEAKLEFEKTLSIEGSIKEFGFDMDRNLYVLWEDYSLSRYNQNTAANFEARFEQSLYEYQGEDLDTNLLISTKNLQGDFLAKEVKLDIKGNAKFKSTNTKTLEVETLDSGELQVPIVITGAGAINIFPKIKA